MKPSAATAYFRNLLLFSSKMIYSDPNINSTFSKTLTKKMFWSYKIVQNWIYDTSATNICITFAIYILFRLWALYSIWVSIHIAVLFLSLFRVYLFLWLISVSFQSLKMTSHLVSFYHSCLLLKFESHLLPQSKLLYAEKERRGFCPTSKEKKATKKFWISDGYFSVYTNFSNGVKKTLHICAFSWENWKMFFYKLSFSSRTNTQNNPTFFKSKGRAKPARKKSELDVQHKTIRRSRS